MEYKMAEATKDISNIAYEAVELALKSGKIRRGTNETTKAIERGTAKLVIAAKDVNPPEVIMHLKPLCEEKKVPYVEVSSKEELGRSSGLHVGTSSVAIIQEGDAKDFIKEITLKNK